MTPAEVREAAAVLADGAATRARGCVEAAEWLTDLASDIRALPLAEEAPPTDAADEAIVDALMARRTAGLATRPIRGERTVPLVDDVLELLPHLTGDEVRRVAEAMPRVAGEWTDRSVTEIGDATGDRMERPAVGHEDIAAGFVRRHSDGERWVAISTGPYCYTTHPTARAAQAACDARLEAAGVRLCGERVREEGT